MKFVTELSSEKVTARQQLSVAGGGTIGDPHCTTGMVVLQVITGGVVSMMLTKLVQKALLPQQSTASQIAEIVSEHGPVVFVIVPDRNTAVAMMQQLSVAVAGTKLHGVPH